MIEKKEQLTYQLMDNNIHWFRINESSRQMIEDLFDKITEIKDSGLYDSQILYLFDSESINELPIRYLIQRANKWEKAQTFIPPTKTALVYQLSGLMIFAVNTLIKTFNKHNSQTRVFLPSQRDEALAWLLSND